MTAIDHPWIVIVWNDPINLMSYVTHVLMELFGYPKDKAEAMMRAIRARVLLMPGETDLYFRVADNEAEKRFLAVALRWRNAAWAGASTSLRSRSPRRFPEARPGRRD